MRKIIPRDWKLIIMFFKNIRGMNGKYFTLFAGEFLFIAALAAALELSWIIWKFLRRVLSPGA